MGRNSISAVGLFAQAFLQSCATAASSLSLRWDFGLELRGTGTHTVEGQRARVPIVELAPLAVRLWCYVRPALIVSSGKGQGYPSNTQASRTFTLGGFFLIDGDQRF
jgi:hypothetical protein